ncbi:family 20 glycosylhydrolase [Paenibacillus sp. NPDC058174]|uniref:beta-N-acetylhexosaminidase n=1 Tax=Paenibacillus sp. NPDC058174 TaxID=3346366 RepID=UPI0036DA7CF6
MSTPVYIYPQPRRYAALNGSSAAAAYFQLRTGDEAAERMAKAAHANERLADLPRGESVSAPHLAAVSASIIVKKNLHPQGYELTWNEDGLQLAAATAQGLHYALLTASQIFAGMKGAAQWGHFTVEDEPQLPVRGVMLDIGRCKIPTLISLRTLIDHLSGLKFNHLQLYMEGFAFDYRKYAELFPDATPITAEEYRELDAYAASRFIDLVPNQNCLGHMGKWLSKPELRHLADHPDGWPLPLPEPLSIIAPPLTLNPADERSVSLARDLFEELLPNFSSPYANINLDEPFGLGTGESKERADEIGVGQLYLDYALKMIEIVREQGKSPLMWGDVLTHYPELADQLPSDLTVLHWNYEPDIPFEPVCQQLQKSGVSYYVCPGTSSWSSLSGRTANMLANIADAAINGNKYGAGGLIVCDWGDGGHWQVAAISYPAYAYAAGAAWQTDHNLKALEPLEYYVSRHMLRDRSGKAAALLLEMGRYHLLERSTAENMTYTNLLLTKGLMAKEQLDQTLAVTVQVQQQFGGSGTPMEHDYRFAELSNWLSQRREELNALQLESEDAVLLKDELANTLLFIEQGGGLHRYIHRQDLHNEAEEKAWLTKLHNDLEAALAEFQRLWLARNRSGGLEESITPFTKLLDQYKEQLA